MWEESFNWLNGHYHELAILLAGAGMASFFSRRYHHWTERLKRAEVECGKIESKLFPQLTSVNFSINSLSGSFDNLVIYLKGKDGEMDASLFVLKSPIELTELGEKILILIGGREFIDNNLQILLEELKLYSIKTPLDVQTYSPIVVSKFSNNNSFDRIKNYIFENPFYKGKNIDGYEIEITLDMGTVSNIMGIYLRNKYLEKYPMFVAATER